MMRRRFDHDPESGLLVPSRRVMPWAPRAPEFGGRGIGPRRAVVSGGGSPTNVQRFGSAPLSLSGGAIDYSIGSVTAGDLVVVGVQQLVNGGSSTPTVTANGSGNTATATVTTRVNFIDGTYGSADLVELAITGSGTLVIKLSAGGGETTVYVVGTQWTGVTFTYDTGGNGSPNGGTQGNFRDIYAASLTIAANRLVVGYFGGNGVITSVSGTPTADAGWGTASGTGSAAPLTIVDKLVSSTTQAHVIYGSFAYGCGLDAAWSY